MKSISCSIDRNLLSAQEIDTQYLIYIIYILLNLHNFYPETAYSKRKREIEGKCQGHISSNSLLLPNFLHASSSHCLTCNRIHHFLQPLSPAACVLWAPCLTPCTLLFSQKPAAGHIGAHTCSPQAMTGPEPTLARADSLRSPSVLSK